MYFSVKYILKCQSFKSIYCVIIAVYTTISWFIILLKLQYTTISWFIVLLKLQYTTISWFIVLLKLQYTTISFMTLVGGCVHPTLTANYSDVLLKMTGIGTIEIILVKGILDHRNLTRRGSCIWRTVPLHHKVCICAVQSLL